MSTAFTKSMTKRKDLMAEDVFCKVNGRTFVCECGCNVFRRGKKRNSYICNSCREVWIGEPLS